MISLQLDLSVMTMLCPVCGKEYAKPGWLRFHLHKNGSSDYRILAGKLYKQLKLSEFVHNDI
ncbi:MAG: hypothetical protein ACW967_06685 [Candidatus Hodarchaeales archaeon]